MGNAKAAVFPLPVSAHPMTSFFRSIAGIQAIWIGVGCLNPCHYITDNISVSNRENYSLQKDTFTRYHHSSAPTYPITEFEISKWVYILKRLSFNEGIVAGGINTSCTDLYRCLSTLNRWLAWWTSKSIAKQSRHLDSRFEIPDEHTEPSVEILPEWTTSLSAEYRNAGD